MIAAVVLAAGASQRLGKPKQLVILGDETLLERAVRTAHTAGCFPVIVVLGAAAEWIEWQSNLGDATVVLNEQWEEGMASSIRLGVRAAENADGVIVMACDQPAVTPAHLQALLATGQVTASAYAGRRGVPAYFPAANFAELMTLEGDAGARDLLRTAHAIELPGGELDIDTAEDILAAELHLQQQRPSRTPD